MPHHLMEIIIIKKKKTKGGGGDHLPASGQALLHSRKAQDPLHHLMAVRVTIAYPVTYSTTLSPAFVNFINTKAPESD